MEDIKFTLEGEEVAVDATEEASVEEKKEEASEESTEEVAA